MTEPPGGDVIQWAARALECGMLLVPRSLAVLSTVPALGGDALGPVLRVAVAAVMVFPIWPVGVQALSALGDDLSLLMLLMAREVFIGVLIGFAVSAFLWVMENFGHLIDQQIGYNNFSLYDPYSQAQAGPLAMASTGLGMCLFLGFGGLTFLAGALYESYAVWPIGELGFAPWRLLEAFAVQQTDSIMIMTVRMTAAILTLMLLIELGMGLIARSAPQLNVFSLSSPIKATVALLVMFLLSAGWIETLIDLLASQRTFLELMQPLSGVR